MTIKAAAFITCMGGSPPTPKYIETPSATEQDASVIEGRDNERRRRRAAASNTVLTSYKGTAPPTTAQPKTLLGS